MFERIEPKNQGKVQVTSFLQAAEEKDLDETPQSKELRMMKEYLEQHVAEKREQISQSRISEVERIKQMRSVENEAELLHVAIGAKHMGFGDVTYDDYNEVVNKLFQQHHKHEIASESNRFARYLRYANVKLNDVPFYPMRKQELDGNKTRAVMIHQQLDNPAMLGRLVELEKTRWRSSLSTINSYYDDEDLRKSKSAERIFGGGEGEGGGGEASTGSLSLSQSLPNLSIPRVATKQDKPSFRPRNLVLEAQKGASLDDTASDAADVLESNSSKSSSPEKRAVKTLQQKTKLFQRVDEQPSQEEQQKRVQQLREQLQKSSSAATDTQSPLSHSSSKLRVLAELTDKSSDLGGRFYQVDSEDRRFLTTTSKFYPPIIYEPSQPPRRVLVSEADMDTQKRNYRRQQRHARKEANLDVTRTRLEYEDLDKQVKELNRMASKNEDKIRYQTNILLEDLRTFKQLPFQRAGRRPNLPMADRIFGGQLDRNTTGVVADNRDFHTTYSANYTNEAFES